jgi:hypothetical protein
MAFPLSRSRLVERGPAVPVPSLWNLEAKNTQGSRVSKVAMASIAAMTIKAEW